MCGNEMHRLKYDRAVRRWDAPAEIGDGGMERGCPSLYMEMTSLALASRSAAAAFFARKDVRSAATGGGDDGGGGNVVALAATRADR